MTGKKYPDYPLQYLIQTKSRPQSEVWSEEIQSRDETELVHRGLLYSDLIIEDQTKHGVVRPLRSRPLLHSGHGC